ncbi:MULTISPECIES: AAA family ATPase [Methylocaldum]|jgi:hypothetical protein|uniref:AAA family ATPase n=1 Tax=unclassified Methylocaldum TaxID=2622260 RepID=UPI00098BCAFB|nr:ATP-binding protein [Methylocaldum sp. 14B]
MSISTFNRHEFGEKLNTVVFPSQPIQSIEHLFGRGEELDQIDKALYAPGRHIFIYGDRGVGKSSLAAIAANQYQSPEADYIDVSCSPDATLLSVVADIAMQAANISRFRSITRQVKKSIDLRFFKIEKNQNETRLNIREQIRTLPEAVELLREVSYLHSEKPIVVLDEFDRISSAEERNLFADLIKQLGDKKIPLKFIFTGVGKTLEELLGAHQSAYRQLQTIELPKLPWEARWEIVLHAARTFGIDVDRDVYIRIAQVSDGYPYYVHLITEKMLWRVYDEAKEVEKVTWEHYLPAIRDAIHSISAELKRPYELAVNQPSGDYEEVLWSTADSDMLLRYLKDMYSSYGKIMDQYTDKLRLDNGKYSARIRNLKNASCGSVLISGNRPGLYSYREKMLRGYVRMQAEANGIELYGEEARSREKQYMHVPARVSTGYRQSMIPRGITFSRNGERK